MATVNAAFVAGIDALIVVSNAASEKTLQALAESEHAERIRLIALPTNVGSAGGFATGLDAAASVEADAIWLLDDDNVAQVNTLERLLAHRAESGAMAHVAFRPDDTPQARVAQGWSVNAAYGPPGSFLYFDLLVRLVQRLRRMNPVPPRTEVTVDVPYAPYGGLLIDIALAKSITGPRREMWLYEDDSEWTARLATRTPLRLCFDAVVHDGDGKWSSNAPRVTGPARLLLADDRERRFYAVRNRAAFDIVRAVTGRQRARLWVNRAIYFAAVRGIGVLRRRTHDSTALKNAVQDGRVFAARLASGHIS